MLWLAGCKWSLLITHPLLHSITHWNYWFQWYFINWVIFHCSVSWIITVVSADPASDHSWWVAVGAAGHAENRLVYKQQRRGEVPTAGAREQGTPEDHSRGTCFFSLSPSGTSSSPRVHTACLFLINTIINEQMNTPEIRRVEWIIEIISYTSLSLTFWAHFTWCSFIKARICFLW